MILQHINKKFGLHYLFVIVFFIFFSCTTQTGITSKIEISGVPVYSIDQEAIVDGIYKFNIHKLSCENYLVMEVSVTNITNKPIAFGLSSRNRYLLSFRLLNGQGTEYAMTGVDNFTYQMGGGIILNPNKSFSGKLTFDVPKDKYTLIATEEILVASYTFKNRDRFKYRLPECSINY